MKAIWCAKDRNKALDDAMSGKGVKPASAILISQTLHAWRAVWRQRYASDGVKQRLCAAGLSGPKELKAFLDEHQKQTSGK
jgi:thiol:disulfide interchange protein DsbC